MSHHLFGTIQEWIENEFFYSFNTAIDGQVVANQLTSAAEENLN